MACTCRQRRAVSRVHNRSCRVYLDACKRKMQPRHVSSSAHETAMYDVHLPPFEPEEETALLEPSSHPSSTPSIPKVFAASPFPLPSSPSSPSLFFVSFFVFVLLDIVI